MTAYLYSIRMRSAWKGRHIGGAERLVSEDAWLDAAQQVSTRARAYPLADAVRVISQLVPLERVHYAPALPLLTAPCRSIKESRADAREWLVRAGVSMIAVGRAFELLDSGPGPGGTVMRGAVILDPETGERREPDQQRGVRATLMDYTVQCREMLRIKLEETGIFHPRIVEALAVATKILWSGAVAELCWSDDPVYVAGYVSSTRHGYRRYENMKGPGVPLGGRVIFLPGSIQPLPFIERLEQAPLLINRIRESG